MRACGGCQLPAQQRAMVADLGRQRVPLRAISERLAEAGHTLSREAVRRHLMHAAPQAETSSPVRTHDPVSAPTDPGDASGLVVAHAAADVLEAWPSIATRLVARLIADGAVPAARVVAEVIPELMRPAVQVPHSPSCPCGPAC